ncbi:WD repeat-containing protein 55 isoform X1 [Tyto alba]|uniref:WD repeat-containing protein 55 isoform X1 n=1 Tax=Tyto alba TaxID=56313 RepID=UPI001C684358|nr:WD repeat-containing protein 55 isoform X1 [Tyto alba]
MAAPGEERSEPRLRETPEDICFEATANAIALHPARPLLAAGDVDGDVYLYSYSCTEGENRQLWSSGHHLKSCRDVGFSQDGQKLFTVSKDKSIHVLTVEEGRLETRFPKAHGSALNCVLPIDNHVFATGDDGGALKVWDLRKEDAILEAREQEEYISAMAVDGNGKILLTTSGDGTLGVFNVKRRRFELLSEPQNGDLTSVVLLKRGRKVACGSSEGTIYLFNWDGFGAASDRFALRAESVDCMVPVTDSIGGERPAEPGAGLRGAARWGAHRAAGAGPGRAAAGQLRPRPEGEVLGRLGPGGAGGGRLPEEEEEGGPAAGPQRQGGGQRGGLLRRSAGRGRAGAGDRERQRRRQQRLRGGAAPGGVWLWGGAVPR